MDRHKSISKMRPTSKAVRFEGDNDPQIMTAR